MKEDVQKQAPVSVHIIGVSGYAKQLLTALHQVIEVAGGRLVSATVINRDQEEETCRALEARGCRIYSDYRAMLANIDAGRNLCLIPTSIYLHAQMTIDALRAGADVLVEKPLAGSVEEAEKMERASQRYGRSVSVGYQDMYAPQVREIKQALSDGACGTVRAIRVTASWPRSAAYYNRNPWAGREFCEGKPVFDSPLNNAFAHFVNLALYFAAAHRDETDGVVSVSGRLFRFYPIETFDTAQVIFRTTSGVEITCLLSHAAAEVVEPNVQIEGTGGSLEWRKEDGATSRDLQGNVLRTWTFDSEDSNRRRMLRSVIANTLANQAPLYPASRAIRHVEAVQKTVRELSIEDGPKWFGLEPRTETSRWKPVSGLMSRLCEEAGLISR